MVIQVRSALARDHGVQANGRTGKLATVDAQDVS